MFKKAGMLFLYTETPLHAGSGSSVSAIDQPIQREAHTGYPMVQASGMKGSLRDLVENLIGITGIKRQIAQSQRKQQLARESKAGEAELKNLVEEEKRLRQSLDEWRKAGIETVFGPDTEGADQHGGALALTDARLLLFPVRSLAGVFAWITCPLALERFQRDLSRLEILDRNGKTTPIPEKENILAQWRGTEQSKGEPKKSEGGLEKSKAWVANDNDSEVKSSDNMVVLEDFAFTIDVSKSEQVKKLGGWLAAYALPPKPQAKEGEKPPPDPYQFWRERLPKALVVVADEVFRDFVQFSTEVITRIRIGESGVVESGALWNEEYLPAEALLYSLALATDPKLNGAEAGAAMADADAVLDFLNGQLEQVKGVMQIGGNETIGRGLVQARLLLPGKK